MSMKSDTSFQHFKGYEELLKRVDDLCNQANRYQKARLTPFLRPNQQRVISSYLGNNVEYHFDGGYSDSELKRMVIGDDYDSSEVVCMCCDIANKNIKITHRDVLGAIMNCGLNRDQFGDIFLADNKAVVYCTYEASRYIKENINQINRLNVEFKEAESFIEYKPNIIEFKKTVSSYRLDSIVSCICNISRSKASDLVKSEMVSVNYEPLEECDYLCDNGDTISVRGYGRYKIIEFIAKTKKERNLIRFGKYD